MASSLPRLPRLAPVSRPCACGCGRGTGRTWFPGCDGRSVGWAIRVERGVVAIDDIPVAGRAGAVLMLARRGSVVPVAAPAARRSRSARRSAAVAPVAPVVAVVESAVEPVAEIG